MKTRFEIEVSEADCKDAVRGNSHYCAVVIAIQRLIGATHVEIDVQVIRFSIEVDGKRYRFVYLTPRAVRDYIIGFDAGDEAKPLRFVLEKPTDVKEAAPRPVGAARTQSFKASARGTGGRRSLRIFGERSFRVNQAGVTPA